MKGKRREETKRKLKVIKYTVTSTTVANPAEKKYRTTLLLKIRLTILVSEVATRYEVIIHVIADSVFE